MASVVESRDGEIERLQSIIKKLQRAQFGRRSERLDPDLVCPLKSGPP
ncbi:transposase [Mesorhizobium sp. AR07]|nr:transposase [Mesorhizobium sp. AR07]